MCLHFIGVGVIDPPIIINKLAHIKLQVDHCGHVHVRLIFNLLRVCNWLIVINLIIIIIIVIPSTVKPR